MTSPTKFCKDVFAHTIDKMVTIGVEKNWIIKECRICGFTERLKRSHTRTNFINNNVLQTKKWAADDNKKELLQPLTPKGEVNDEFTEAYGFNPHDPRTKATTPRVQGGLA